MRSQQLERPNEVGPEDLDGSRHTGATAGRQPVRVGAAHEDGPSAEAERLHDVAAAADSSVQEDLGLSVHGGDHLRQDAQGRRDAIELAATVIGNDDGFDAVVDRAASVLARMNTLDDDRPLPGFPDPAEILPAHHRLLQGGATSAYGIGPSGSTTLETSSSAVGEESREPSRAGEELGHEGQHRPDPAREELLVPFRTSRSRSPATGCRR